MTKFEPGAWASAVDAVAQIFPRRGSRAGVLPRGAGPLPTDREANERRRVAIHEAGHAVVMRALGTEVAGATVTATSRYGGAVWMPGMDDILHFDPARETAERATISRRAKNLLSPGDAFTDGAAWIAHAVRCSIELVAGYEAELEFELESDPTRSLNDFLQATGYADSISMSSTPGAIESFITYAHTEARGIICKYKPAVAAVADALIERNTLTGAEIDSIIAQALAREGLEAERARRARWAKVIAGAASAKLEVI